MKTNLKVYSLRERNEMLRVQLENERQSFEPQWRDANDFVRPTRGRFFLEDVNKGDRRNQFIIDSSATFSLRTMAAGMMSGITSPARPWFKLATPYPDLNKLNSVKMYLDDVTNILTNIFVRTNLYKILPSVYTDMGTFAIGAMIIDEDYDDVFRCYSIPVGSFSIANDYKLRVRTFFRTFRWSVRQVVERFGYDEETNEIDWSNISAHVKNAYEMNEMDQWIDLCHVIKPNDYYDPKKSHISKFKKFASIYYERGTCGSASNADYMSGEEGEKTLEYKGYDYFPVLTPRWGVTGEDVYGTDCPTFDAIGDIRQLQVGEERSLQAVEKQINPPMVGPSVLRDQGVDHLPGGTTYLDENGMNASLRSLYNINLNIQQLEMKQEQVRARIRRAYFEDLFLMLAMGQDRERTATEIAERKEEKLLALGPVLEQLNQDLLDPLIDIAFYLANKQGLLPEPPEELQDVELRVEYVSIMAQAQKYLGLSSMDRFSQFYAGLMNVTQGAVARKVNAEEMLTVYADITGIPPNIVVPDDVVAAQKAQEQQAIQQQTQLMQAQEAATTAKTLSDTSTEGSNALNSLIDMGQAGSLT